MPICSSSVRDSSGRTARAQARRQQLKQFGDARLLCSNNDARYCFVVGCFTHTRVGVIVPARHIEQYPSIRSEVRHWAEPRIEQEGILALDDLVATRSTCLKRTQLGQNYVAKSEPHGLHKPAII
jgi:hypothetical protein